MESNTAEAYFANVQELNAEVRAFVQSQSEPSDFVLPQAIPIVQKAA